MPILDSRDSNRDSDHTPMEDSANTDEEKHARSHTEGRARLTAFLDAEAARTQEWLAGRLGIGQPTVHAWTSGRSRPSPELREAVEILIGVPAELWMTARERGFIANAKRRANDEAA